LDDFGGLLLTGGPDVDPALYGAARHPETEEPDRERDDAEMELVREALDADVPLLAICRGLQLLNVFHGGDLMQHLDTTEHHRQPEGDRAAPVHNILIEPGSLLHAIAGAREWHVNSRHHQGVRNLGRGLRVSAIDPEDGLIEAVERPDKRFVLAVQWHPENQAMVDAEQLRIFQRFGEALRREPALTRMIRD
jgi:putative glutamine amidotransferase